MILYGAVLFIVVVSAVARPLKPSTNKISGKKEKKNVILDSRQRISNADARTPAFVCVYIPGRADVTVYCATRGRISHDFRSSPVIDV